MNAVDENVHKIAGLTRIRWAGVTGRPNAIAARDTLGGGHQDACVQLLHKIVIVSDTTFVVIGIS